MTKIHSMKCRDTDCVYSCKDMVWYDKAAHPCFLQGACDHTKMPRLSNGFANLMCSVAGSSSSSEKIGSDNNQSTHQISLHSTASQKHANCQGKVCCRIRPQCNPRKGILLQLSSLRFKNSNWGGPPLDYAQVFWSDSVVPESAECLSTEGT